MTSGVRLGAVVAVILTATNCGPSRFDSEVRQYVRLAVALGERDPDSIDFYYGPPPWVADIRHNPPRLQEIRATALEAARELNPDRHNRAQHLAAQLTAIAARADEMLGHPQTFDQRTSAYFGLTLPPPREFGQDRAEIDRLLPGKGSLAERYAAFDRQFLVPSDRLPAVMTRAIEGCRSQTLRHLQLPAGEAVRVEYVHDKPWSAFSRYQGDFHSVVSVNADLDLTVDRALQLACHEAYPGHHVQNVLQDLRFVRGFHWMEWTVQPTFSPQSLVSEALATFAVRVAFPAEERMRFERDALFPLAGFDPKTAGKYDHVERLVDKLQSAEPAIARDFLDGKLEWSRAASALEQQALMTSPEQTLKYVSEYRTYMVTYTLGPDLVAEHVHNWKEFAQAMTDPDAASRIIMKR
jgi:hypothetical protein